MFHPRYKLLSASLLLLGFSMMPALSGTALAQAGAESHSPVPLLQFAQYSSTVLELQRELNQIGYSAGPADGLMGARTRGAIQAYQRDHNLLVDGQPTSRLLSHVRATAQSQTPARAPQGPDPASQQVAEIQEALRSLGYKVGRSTGRLDDETRAAIRSYESDHNLLMSGEPGTELLRHMRGRIESTPAAPAVDANTLARIQSELRLRGYEIPLISGRMDAQTRQAIREYQQGQGVSPSGEPSTALLEELRATSAAPTPAVGYSRDERAAAQRALSARGYDAGPPDGVLGPRSRNAIRSFQADNNLNPSGELTSSTMALLGIGKRASELASEPPKVAAAPYRVRVQDDFRDGDHARNPTWRIISGRFEVRNGGLTSAMAPPSDRPGDIGRQLLGDLLKQQMGLTLPGEESIAAAHLPTRIAPEFRITTEVSGSAEQHGHIDLGPYRGNQLNYGYRLIYRADQPQPLHLVSATENGMTTLASARLRFDRGARQRLVWERDAEGRMTVTRNGEVLIDVIDRNQTGQFDGFSLINAGGEWTLHEVIVEDRN